jgi:hypothetical protein
VGPPVDPSAHRRLGIFIDGPQSPGPHASPATAGAGSGADPASGSAGVTADPDLAGEACPPHAAARQKSQVNLSILPT